MMHAHDLGRRGRRVLGQLGCAVGLLSCLAGCGGGSGTGTSGGGTNGSGAAGSGGASGAAGAQGSAGTGGPGSAGTSGATAGTAGSTGGGSGGVSGGSAGAGAGGTAHGGAAGGVAGTTGAGGGVAGASGVAGMTGAGGGAAGAGGGGVAGARVRDILPFDAGWLFFKGDATGADQAAFADGAWRSLNVPHDWAIEGPFSQTATTTGRGGYVPAGIAWYRKHFTLPQSLAGRRVYVELDGVMENSDVYINGTHLGHHPYGWVSFRYDLTSSVMFGTADNVIAVKTDTTTQPAERYYAGAGIYRHVRVVAANPVHVDQWATFVTTPTPTTTSATVHVTTTVVNTWNDLAERGGAGDRRAIRAAPRWRP